MKIHLEFEPHEHEEAKNYLRAQDDAAVLHDFCESLRQILKHSDDEDLIKYAEWAQNQLIKLAD